MLAVTSGRSWSTALALALGGYLLVDLLRIWLPSVITIYGGAGPTAGSRLGLFAALWVALGLVAVPLVGPVNPRLLAMIGALGMGTARAVLQGTNGGPAQLYLASLGVTAAVVWLVSMAGSSLAGRSASVGVTAGIAAAVTVHVALRTVDLLWWAGPGPWLAVVLAGLALVAVTWLATSRGERETATPGLWFTIGPVLLLVGVVTGSPARAEAAAGWGQYQASFVLLIACCLGVLGCLRARALTRSPLVAALALLALLAGATLPRTTVNGITGLLPGWVVWAQAGSALALAACLGWAGEGQRRTLARRRAAAAGAGVVLCWVLAAGYTAYDTSPSYPNRWLLLVGGVLVGTGAVAGAGSAHTWAPMRDRARQRRVDFAVLAATCVALIGALVTAAASIRPITNHGPARYPVRLVSYDVRMGFDLRGHFDPDDIGQTIQAQRPDIVVLNEVDRGKMTDGGHDVLQLIAEYLGMPYLFAPAADEVQGNAILTRFPIRSVFSEPIADPGSPTGASALAVVLSLDSGQQLAVVATHFQPDNSGQIPLAEVQRAHQLAIGLIAKDRAVVLAGNLNAQPGSRQLAALGPDLVDALASRRPLPTFPSDRPDQQLDHVFVTPDLTASNIQVPASADSDHRAVAVTVAPRS